MEYGKVCDEILGCDGSIRYVGIYDYGTLHDMMREGLTSHLSREETEASLSQAVYRWSTRKKTTDKIGSPVYAMAKYEKICRITIPLGGAGLILVTTEIGADIEGIASRVMAIRDAHSGP